MHSVVSEQKSGQNPPKPTFACNKMNSWNWHRNVQSTQGRSWFLPTTFNLATTAAKSLPLRDERLFDILQRCDARHWDPPSRVCLTRIAKLWVRNEILGVCYSISPLKMGMGLLSLSQWAPKNINFCIVIIYVFQLYLSLYNLESVWTPKLEHEPFPQSVLNSGSSNLSAPRCSSGAEVTLCHRCLVHLARSAPSAAQRCIAADRICRREVPSGSRSIGQSTRCDTCNARCNLVFVGLRLCWVVLVWLSWSSVWLKVNFLGS